MRTRASPPAGTGRASVILIHSASRSAVGWPPARASAPVTTAHGSGRPVAASMTRSSVATLPLRMTLKKYGAPALVAVTS